MNYSNPYDPDVEDEIRKKMGFRPGWQIPEEVRARAHGEAPPLPEAPAPGSKEARERAKARLGRMAARARKLAGDAMCLDLAAAAGDPALSRETVRVLSAHGLALGHGLAMRLGAVADQFIDYVQPAGIRDPYVGKAPQETVRLINGVARMMERCRGAALTLHRIGFPGEPDPAPKGDPKGDGSGPGKKNGKERKPKKRYIWPDYMMMAVEEHKAEKERAEKERAAREPGTPDPKPAARHYADPGQSRGRLKNGNPTGDYRKAPRCGARTRAGGCCGQPAMPNGRCRFHGGKSTGPRTAAGLQRSRDARLIHGLRSAEIIELRATAARVGRTLQALTAIAKDRFTAKPQSTRSDRPLDRNTAASPAGYRVDRSESACAAAGCIIATPPEGAMRVGKEGRDGFVPFVASWCNSSARNPIPAGYGVHRPDSPIPLAAPVQSAGFAARKRAA
jgi:hypothetical protein